MTTFPNALVPSRHQAVWPALPLGEWQDTLSTLQRWLQIVGKTRLALAPRVNHWWHVTLYLTARGLTTSPMPSGGRSVENEIDFLDHRLLIRTSDGLTRSIPLAPRSVADFYREFTSSLEALGIEAHIWPVPRELADTVRFPDDHEHRSYDPEYAGRCWRVLAQSHQVLQQFRARFLGKCSPVHFFWGAFDLACTRFSGRTAPRHPGGAPNLPDWVVREAYSHECISAGWWPGGGPVQEAAYYCYSYPEPPGFSDAPVPAGAFYHRDLKEFVLPYEVVRSAERPVELVLDFFEATYQGGADLLGWDRQALDFKEKD